MPGQDLETQILEKIKNKYLLTILISRRINQLKRGAKPLIETDRLMPYDIALREIAAGKVTLQYSTLPESPTTKTEGLSQSQANAEG